MRFRHVFMGIGGLLVFIILLATDPDGGILKNIPFGSSTLSLLIILLTSILYIGMLHLGRKGLIDYINLEEYFKKALMTPEGSGLALIAVGLIMISVSLVILAATK